MCVLEQKGRLALKNVTLSKEEGTTHELEQLRFRDADLSTNGGAMLGFSGLMLASNLVFLSADPSSLIAPRIEFAWLAFVALFVLAGGSYFATGSIVERAGIREQAFGSSFEYFGAIESYHDKRRFWLSWSRRLTFAGSGMFLASIMLSCVCRFLS